jgi:putative PIN family toxin of toxin-antitoxin system
MKVVLDTNVLIAAFIAHGVCSDLFEHCVQHHELVTSEFMLDEFRRVMVNRFHFGVREVRQATELLRSRATFVKPANLGAAVCRDPDDDAVLSTAIAGEAVCIITGDEDLLVLKRFRGVSVVRPADFAEYEASYLSQAPPFK